MASKSRRTGATSSEPTWQRHLERYWSELVDEVIAAYSSRGVLISEAEAEAELHANPAEINPAWVRERIAVEMNRGRPGDGALSSPGRYDPSLISVGSSFGRFCGALADEAPAACDQATGCSGCS